MAQLLLVPNVRAKDCRTQPREASHSQVYAPHAVVCAMRVVLAELHRVVQSGAPLAMPVTVDAPGPAAMLLARVRCAGCLELNNGLAPAAGGGRVGVLRRLQHMPSHHGAP